MDLAGIGFDQLRVFVAVAEDGSFSATARRLNRAQSAVTYAVQKLEASIGATLFDRGGYRPALTEAGAALLPRARRVLEAGSAFQKQADALSQGLEAELRVVVDAMFPMTVIFAALSDFGVAFPSVQPRLYVETMGATAEAVLTGMADIGFAISFASESDQLVTKPSVTIEMVPVAAPTHPLAEVQGVAAALLEDEVLRDHVQLVLTDRTDRTKGKDNGVLSMRTWRLADLGAKHAMLLAGLGWGNMPSHIVANDLQDGRLVELRTAHWAGRRRPVLSAEIIRHRERSLGIASTWFLDRVTSDMTSARVFTTDE